jgi:hypothetical protein
MKSSLRFAFEDHYVLLVRKFFVFWSELRYSSKMNHLYVLFQVNLIHRQIFDWLDVINPMMWVLSFIMYLTKAIHFNLKRWHSGKSILFFSKRKCGILFYSWGMYGKHLSLSLSFVSWILYFIKISRPKAIF